VNEARQDRERRIDEAQQPNREIPKAKGEAARTIIEAEGYALERVNRAKGEAERFRAVLAEYHQAREVTRRRLYLETLSDVLPDAKAERRDSRRDGERASADQLGRISSRQEIRGEADAGATRIYGAAYGRDPEFYAFSRTLETYREGQSGTRCPS
jgi:regulator of protease activity HflC (stomatin/prohibitin superfamily)